jgi:hypothetical protein
VDDGAVHLIYGNSIQRADLKAGRCSTKYNLGSPNQRIICETTDTAIMHYFMFDDMVIDFVYKDNILEYVNADTREQVLVVKLR